MKFEALKDSAQPVAELQKADVQAAMRGCEVIYGLEMKEHRVVQFRRKTAEGTKKPVSGKSLVFTYDKDRGEYEVLLAAATVALGECAVMREE